MQERTQVSRGQRDGIRQSQHSAVSSTGTLSQGTARSPEGLVSLPLRVTTNPAGDCAGLRLQGERVTQPPLERALLALHVRAPSRGNTFARLSRAVCRWSPAVSPLRSAHRTRLFAHISVPIPLSTTSVSSWASRDGAAGSVLGEHLSGARVQRGCRPNTRAPARRRGRGWHDKRADGCSASGTCEVRVCSVP
ncbi:uncharacterized protein LOC123625772 isoform X7 [Lemur catta]|uniref:uncharacterized protein LOC123625772 isoform X7 n=1 Tax=Lemur catta TaxID=9447 RepID=UPI001E26927C|nr:uncharacterized protein LOC123625772 isoform X7 [Lemur catta]XP_045390280.1 uncharacterized protein LOC123625772 isoform X7 [Lemur catta]XP_045390281.1 uncharacterized protein LOC123625772 isoform X7 [Lemur catta]